MEEEGVNNPLYRKLPVRYGKLINRQSNLFNPKDYKDKFTTESTLANFFKKLKVDNLKAAGYTNTRTIFDPKIILTTTKLSF